MINPSIPQSSDQLKPRITVIGVGGAGGNAVNNMISANLEGVEFLVCNTDAQAMQQSLASRKIQLGANITRGLGAGARADVGRAAAEEAMDEIMQSIEGSNMVFITAGMGGGTGTGAAPVIARAAREHGILTVGVVTKPFHFEGSLRMRQAESGIDALQDHVDTLIIIPNQNLFRVANEQTTFADAFNMADQVLHSGVRGVTDLMVMPGLINLDFNDIRSVMSEMGKAMMGTGEADGSRRAVEAAEAAISNPLLDDVSMKGARGVLINITGGMDMTLFEVDEAANRIRDEVDPDANIIFGSTFDASMNGKMRVSVVATGIEAEAAQRTRPEGLRMVANGAQHNPFTAAASANAARSANTTTATVSSTPSPFANTQPSNTNATPPAAATASAGGMRPMSQNTAASFGQATAPASSMRMQQPQASAQSGLRVTSTAPTSAPSQPSFNVAPQSYGSAALQMQPAAQAPAPAAPAPSLTVVNNPTPTQNEPSNYAPSYDETPSDPAPMQGSPWTSMATTAAPAPHQTQPQAQQEAPQPAPTTAAEPAQSNFLFSEEDAPRAPAPAATAKKKGPSLFERVTGIATGRAKPNDMDDDSDDGDDAARGSSGSFMGLNLGNAQAAPAIEPQRREPQLVNQQPAKLSQADEDLLEIPAFLRRQAN
ncbi:MAG TPA: cell division protein FtsZ [Alphaproteobacteria bacterium]|nr:cell division protein FtsZ [Rhodospirillaceae bacterium]HRJ11853.1 cell division protein FtsZ [Alphaproteobacteria bacterium]